MSTKPNVVLPHQQDPSWILALYFAVYGGDPGPEQHITLTNQQYANVGAQVIASIASSLAGVAPSASEAEMLRTNRVLRGLGIEIADHNYVDPNKVPKCVKIAGYGSVCPPIVRWA